MKRHSLSVSFVLFVVLMTTLTGCRSVKVVEVEKVHTDTTYIRQQMWDSIHVHDSIYVREKNDTVRIERWHTKYIERLRTDTVYQSRVDSVPVPYPVEVKVQRELTWWQKFRLTLGTIALGAIGVGIVLLILKIKKNSMI